MKPKRIVHIHGDTPIEEQWVEPTTSVSSGIAGFVSVS